MVAGLAVASTAAGCLLGSFSDLQGGDVADAGDASIDVIDSGNDAAIRDAVATDVFVPADAAPGVRFCSTQIDAAFCDDFDQVDAAPLALWQPPTTTNGSSITTTSTGFSAPNALLATVPANGASGLLIPANVSHQLSGTVKLAHYAYDVLVDFYDTGGSNAYIGAIDERVGTADTEVRLILSAAGVLAAGVVTPGDGGASTFPTLSAKVSVSGATWHHVDLLIDYTSSPTAVTFTFDSAIVANHVAVPGATFGAGNITVEAGFLYVSTPTSGWKIRVDNVAVFTE